MVRHLIAPLFGLSFSNQTERENYHKQEPCQRQLQHLQSYFTTEGVWTFIVYRLD